jgi:hypothetical protein
VSLRNGDDVHVADGVVQDPRDDVRLVDPVREADACTLSVDDERVDAEDDVGAVVEDRATGVAEAGPAAIVRRTIPPVVSKDLGRARI